MFRRRSTDNFDGFLETTTEYQHEWTMPNAVNKCKTNLLMKMEKENENKDLRRKLKNLNKERSPGVLNKETVWDRLSRVKKSASNDGGFLPLTKSRTLMPVAKSTLRLQTRTVGQRVNKKPLTPNTNLNKRVGEKKSVRRLKSKTPYLQDLDVDDNKLNCTRVKSIKEILTARSICNSKTSSEDCTLKIASARSDNISALLKDNQQLLADYDEYEDSEVEMQIESQDSLEEFVVAPLMPVPTNESLNMSATIASNFRCLLDSRQKNMAPDEIATIKNVVKTDQRHRQLQRNDSVLFKEILKTQLKEIIRQETVVKSALHNLNEFPSTIAIHKPQTMDTETKKPQVDVIFKNVPTLEKEIIILKALGEKLEATLKRTVSQGDMKLAEMNKLATPTESKWHSAYMDNFQYAYTESLSLGVRRCIGIVQEFRMEHKTIVELKEQASHHFYLPSNKDSTELKRTSFKRLKENPDLLMRYLKPKSTLVPFNVLEQDPCFFNSFLYSPCVIGSFESAVTLTKADMSTTDERTKTPLQNACDSDRSARVPYKYEKEPLQIEEIQCTLNDALYTTPPAATEQQQQVEDNSPLVAESKSSSRVRKAPVLGRKRRRIRQYRTPLPTESNPDPKNNLFKTILVGSVQISVFLILIMAITYPDVRC